jgi:hypothetical protein
VTRSNELGDKRVKLRTKSLSELELTTAPLRSLGRMTGHPAAYARGLDPKVPRRYTTRHAKLDDRSMLHAIEEKSSSVCT